MLTEALQGTKRSGYKAVGDDAMPLEDGDRPLSMVGVVVLDEILV